MSYTQIISNFSDIIENGKGQLFLDDELYFLSNKYVLPTFTSNDFSKAITTWSNFGDRFQTNFSLDKVKLNGSIDNFCYILQSNMQLAPNQYIEIINQSNLTGVRIENVSNQTLSGFNFYNHLNRSIFGINGKKYNSTSLDVAITIPDKALDYLFFDSNLGEYHNLTLYPDIKVVSNSNQSLFIKLKNQRVYA
jgi:hypothetical protein